MGRGLGHEDGAPTSGVSALVRAHRAPSGLPSREDTEKTDAGERLSPDPEHAGTLILGCKKCISVYKPPSMWDFVIAAGGD